MNVVIFGATGMVGQGVLRASLAAPDVLRVLSVGRTATGVRHPKLIELIRHDLFDYAGVETALQGYDACFFCLGVASSGMTEAAYARLTYHLTVTVAALLARLNRGMTFVYVSGAGTDGSERGRRMWARVKGRTENALLKLPFKAAYMFRPGIIQPLHGARSKTRMYRMFYDAAGPLLGLARRLAPRWVLTTDSMGQAMLNVVRHGAPHPILEAPDIHAAAEGQ